MEAFDSCRLTLIRLAAKQHYLRNMNYYSLNKCTRKYKGIFETRLVDQDGLKPQRVDNTASGMLNLAGELSTKV
jgi:hypothetical protein